MSGGWAPVPSWVMGHPAESHGIAVFFHGGTGRARPRPAVTDPAYLRMVPFALACRARSRGQIAGILVSHPGGGWMGRMPVLARELDSLARQLVPIVGDKPLCIVGHSSGGHAALVAAARWEDTFRVAGVAALAPHVPDGRTYAGHAPVLLAHGTRDRVTSFAASRALAQRLAADGRDVTFESVDDGHAMLRRAGTWHRFVADFALRGLVPR